MTGEVPVAWAAQRNETSLQAGVCGLWGPRGHWAWLQHLGQPGGGLLLEHEREAASASIKKEKKRKEKGSSEMVSPP